MLFLHTYIILVTLRIKTGRGQTFNYVVNLFLSNEIVKLVVSQTFLPKEFRLIRPFFRHSD